MTGDGSAGPASKPVNRLIAILPYVSLFGFVAIIPNLFLTFEEPHAGMLLAATLLLSAAPAGLFLHLATTRELSPQERRAWLAGLVSRRATRLFAAYFDASERRRATQALVVLARRRV